MKNPFIALGALLTMSIVSALSASADNTNVENALVSRPDLSDFYRLMVSTGVNHELNLDTSYTVFAPTNDVFAQMRQDQCSYRPGCQAQLAEIVRNHIVPDKIHIDSAAKHEGGLFSLGRFVTIGEPSRDDYTIGGNNILSESSFHGGILYRIDGVIANPREVASLENPQIKEVTIATRHTIPDPACGPSGCPDASTQTTTIIRTVDDPYSFTETPLPFLP